MNLAQEAAAVSVASVLVGWLGSTAGEAAAVVLCSLIGALLAVGSERTPGSGLTGIVNAVWFLARGVLVALVGASAVAWALGSMLGVPHHLSLSVAALAIGATTGRWRTLRDALVGFLVSLTRAAPARPNSPENP